MTAFIVTPPYYHTNNRLSTAIFCTWANSQKFVRCLNKMLDFMGVTLYDLCMEKKFLDLSGMSYFWNKIKSYVDSRVGGSSEEIYSVEETRIGTWIDGKPLYRKAGAAKISGSVNTWIKICDQIPDAEIKTIQVTDNYDTNNATYGKGCISLCYPGSNSARSAITYFYGGTSYRGLYITLDGATMLNGTIEFVLEYTKTTDGN